MCPLLAQLKIDFFFFAVAVYSTNEANKAGLKQSIFLDVYGLSAMPLLYILFVVNTGDNCYKPSES
jgi:hypothetical protein